jgi:hypothetical protein
MKSRLDNINLYNKIHLWLKRKLGKANHCAFCNEGEKKYEWALKWGCDYEFNTDNFVSLCISCHRKYDATDEYRKKCSERLKKRIANGEFKIPLKKGAPSPTTGNLHPSAKRIVQKDRKTGLIIANYGSLKEAVDKNQFKYGNLSMCLTGRNPAAYGYLWEYLEEIDND